MDHLLSGSIGHIQSQDSSKEDCCVKGCYNRAHVSASFARSSKEFCEWHSDPRFIMDWFEENVPCMTTNQRYNLNINEIK